MTADTHTPNQPTPRIGPKRAAFQWLCTLLLLVIPFVTVDGQSLLRADFSRLTLHAFGHNFPITDLPLFLLLCIAMVLLFLLVTLAFGRAWCGWACPQTTLVDLVEWVARRSGVVIRAGQFTTTPRQALMLHSLYLALSLLVGANLTWYFISPYEFFPALLAGRLHWVGVLFLGIVSVTIYLDLAFLRRLFCKEFCPYGRFQTALIDPGTLTLHFHPDEAPRCIQCGACVRSCPTGIDIRRGDQIECINCGRCLDACRDVMARRHQAGIIRYTFGLEGRGMAALLNLRMALVSLAFVGLCVGLVMAMVQRPEVSLKAARNPQLMPRATDHGRVANFYTLYLTNRTGERLDASLDVDNPLKDVIMTGATRMQSLAPGDKKRFDVALETASSSLAVPRPVNIIAVGRNGQSYGSVTIYLTRPMESHEQ